MSQIASKIFATQCLFSEHLNHKTVNKATCRTPSANPCQLWTHWLKSFGNVAVISWGFEDFLIYLAKCLIIRKYKTMKFYINGLTKQTKFQEHSRIKDSVEKYA